MKEKFTTHSLFKYRAILKEMKAKLIFHSLYRNPHGNEGKAYLMYSISVFSSLPKSALSLRKFLMLPLHQTIRFERK